MELTSEAGEFLRGIFRLFDTDNVCQILVPHISFILYLTQRTYFFATKCNQISKFILEISRMEHYYPVSLLNSFLLLLKGKLGYLISFLVVILIFSMTCLVDCRIIVSQH